MNTERGVLRICPLHQEREEGRNEGRKEGRNEERKEGRKAAFFFPSFLPSFLSFFLSSFLSDDELAVDIVYCNDFQLVESGPGIRPFSAAIFATTAHILVHFRRLRHL